MALGGYGDNPELYLAPKPKPAPSPYTAVGMTPQRIQTAVQPLGSEYAATDGNTYYTPDNPAPTPSPYTGTGVAPTMPSAPAAPSPMRDIDWFNSDAQFRQQAGGMGTDLADQLAQLLYQRGRAYNGIDEQRRDWGQSRDKASGNVGEDFAARGLLSSGLYRQALDSLLGEYERSSGRIDTTEQDLTQQLGQRGSLTGGIDRNALFDSNFTGLADIYGLLGSQGVSAGNQYNQALQSLRGESAGRSTEQLINTLGWA